MITALLLAMHDYVAEVSPETNSSQLSVASLHDE